MEDALYGCYLRVGDPGPWAGPWAGIARLEMPSGIGRAAAVEAAARAAGWLPGFASALPPGRAGPGEPDADCGSRTAPASPLGRRAPRVARGTRSGARTQPRRTDGMISTTMERTGGPDREARGDLDFPPPPIEPPVAAATSAAACDATVHRVLQVAAGPGAFWSGRWRWRRVTGSSRPSSSSAPDADRAPSGGGPAQPLALDGRATRGRHPRREPRRAPRSKRPPAACLARPLYPVFFGRRRPSPASAGALSMPRSVSVASRYA